ILKFVVKRKKMVYKSIHLHWINDLSGIEITSGLLTDPYICSILNSLIVKFKKWTDYFIPK
ncbi:MAG TPA: hypothetical protein P5084_06960, partial [Paludibacter sp.]|nr:hypothetical protein [Paludibacter sp.]